MMAGMRDIRIEKVVVNVGVGEAGEKLVKAQKVLELVTKQKSVQTLSHRAVRDWGVRRNMPIGTRVTLRGKAADGFLKAALEIRNNRLPAYSFDSRGNFSFGIQDYTDFPGMKYDPEIGVFGMDVAVSLQRPGFRVARRAIRTRTIPRRHRVSREEGMAFLKDRYKVEVVE
jgi:large subunit ribosomal protein L5